MFWSPDSRSIFFSVRETLKQVNLDTGSGRTVAEIPDTPQLGLWRSNGDLVLYLRSQAHVMSFAWKTAICRKARVSKAFAGRNSCRAAIDMVYAVNDRALQAAMPWSADYTSRKPVSLMQTDSRVQYAPPAARRRARILAVYSAGEPARPALRRQTASGSWASRFRSRRTSFITARHYRPISLCPPNGVLVYQANFPSHGVELV